MLAMHIQFIAKGASYWFIINGIHDYYSSIDHRCRLSEVSYYGLIVAAILVYFTPNNTLIMKPREWESFVDESELLLKDEKAGEKCTKIVEPIPPTSLHLEA